MGERHRLDSWKQIGDFLGCSTRTAQRHAKDRRLPVHYVGGARGTRVFAFTDELEEWMGAPVRAAERVGTAGPQQQETAPPAREEGPEAESPGPLAASIPAAETAPSASTDPPGGSEPIPGLPVPPLRPSAKEWASSLAQQMMLRDPDEFEPDPGPDTLPSWRGSPVPPAVPPSRSPATSPANGERPALPDSGPAARRPWRIRVPLWISLPLVVLVGVVIWREWKASRPENRLARVEERGNTLVALDAAGEELWQHEFPHSMKYTTQVFGLNQARNLKQASRVIDLDGDGEPEVLAVTGMEGLEEIQPWVLYCLDSRGTIRWEFNPGESMAFRKERCDQNWTLCFEVVDLDNDKRHEILVLSHNHRLFPAKITLLDPQGRPQGEFVNSGWVENVNYADLDGDGTLEILAAGCNNGYKQPCLIVLHADAVAGCSPQPDTPDYQCPGRPPGREMYYLLFPRDPVMQKLAPIGAVWAVVVAPGQIIASLPSAIEKPPLSGSMEYIFDYRLRLESVEANSVYELLYGRLFEQGLINHPFSPAVARELGPVLYWDGERFVPTPAVNRHWRGFEQERRAER